MEAEAAGRTLLPLNGQGSAFNPVAPAISIFDDFWVFVTKTWASAAWAAAKLRATLGASITACTTGDALLAGACLISGIEIGGLFDINRSGREIFLNVWTPNISLVVMQAGKEKLIISSSRTWLYLYIYKLYLSYFKYQQQLLWDTIAITPLVWSVTPLENKRKWNETTIMANN